MKCADQDSEMPVYSCPVSVPWPQQMVTSQTRSLCHSGSLNDSMEQLPFPAPPPAHLHRHVVWLKNNLKWDTTGISGLIYSCSITYPILTNDKKVCTFLRLYYILPQIAFQKMIPNYTPTSNVWECPALSLTLVLLWGWGLDFIWIFF